MLNVVMLSVVAPIEHLWADVMKNLQSQLAAVAKYFTVVNGGMLFSGRGRHDTHHNDTHHNHK
jgi:hypothetical protein